MKACVSRKSLGFTFIELLFVFSLVSILTLMILPALSKMKEKGRQATCIGNQRQLAVAAILYANEALCKLPLSLVKAVEDGYAVTDCGQANNVLSYGDEAYAQSAMSALYNANYDITRCPEVSGSVLDDVPTFSYGINVYVTGMKLDLIENASTTVMLTDSHYEGVSSSNEVAFRHANHLAIAAFVDGHIELFTGIVPPTQFTPQFDTEEEYTEDPPVVDPPADDPPADGPVVRSYPPIVDENGFEIIMITSTDPEDGTTISIDLSSTPLTDKALSHVSYTFNIDLPHDVLQLIADSASSTMGYPVVVVDPDPQTGLRGIKFDETALGEDGVIESCNFTFSVPIEHYNNMDSVSVTTKAGQGIYTTTVDFDQE
ncbi:MAG: type II secretion system protein [Candidatus Auribacterota bacterium]